MRFYLNVWHDFCYYLDEELYSKKNIELNSMCMRYMNRSATVQLGIFSLKSNSMKSNNRIFHLTVFVLRYITSIIRILSVRFKIILN